MGRWMDLVRLKLLRDAAKRGKYAPLHSFLIQHFLLQPTQKEWRTTFQELERVLGGKYLRNPQVTVTVAASVSQKVSVQGEVREPGVYPLSGPTTLLGVISMAKGETEVATLSKVVVFRTINGQRMGAMFDVAGIRRGQASDPVIQGNDMVVVESSGAKKFWKGVLSAAPLLNIFRPVTGL